MTQLRLALAALALVALIGLGFYVVHLRKDAATARLEAAAAQANATVSQGGASAAQDAANIIAQGASRSNQTQVIHDQNTTTIREIPGSSDPLPAGLHDATVSGLCKYTAYHDDPACAGVRPADPAKLP